MGGWNNHLSGPAETEFLDGPHLFESVLKYAAYQASAMEMREANPMLMRYPMLVGVLIACSFIAISIVFISPLAVIIGCAIGAHVYTTELIKRDGVERTNGVTAGLRLTAVIASILIVVEVALFIGLGSGNLWFLFADEVGASAMVFVIWISFGVIVGIPISFILSPFVASRVVRHEEDRIHRARMNFLGSEPPFGPGPTQSIDPWS